MCLIFSGWDTCVQQQCVSLHMPPVSYDTIVQRQSTLARKCDEISGCVQRYASILRKLIARDSLASQVHPKPRFVLQ